MLPFCCVSIATRSSAMACFTKLIQLKVCSWTEINLRNCLLRWTGRTSSICPLSNTFYVEKYWANKTYWTIFNVALAEFFFSSPLAHLLKLLNDFKSFVVFVALLTVYGRTFVIAVSVVAVFMQKKAEKHNKSNIQPFYFIFILFAFLKPGKKYKQPNSNCLIHSRMFYDYALSFVVYSF